MTNSQKLFNFVKELQLNNTRQIYNKMTIRKDTREKWDSMKERGDVPALMELTGLSRGSIYNILSNGRCKREVAIKFQEYFDSKKAEVKQTASISEE